MTPKNWSLESDQFSKSNGCRSFQSSFTGSKIDTQHQPKIRGNEFMSNLPLNTVFDLTEGKCMFKKYRSTCIFPEYEARKASQIHRLKYMCLYFTAVRYLPLSQLSTTYSAHTSDSQRHPDGDTQCLLQKSEAKTAQE